MSLTWSDRVRKLKAEVLALYLAYRDPRTPWHARVFTALVVSYALSPIDLIPDFIPILGILDDMILVPVGLALALKMIPEKVMAESREKAIELAASGKPISRGAAVVIISIWLLSAYLFLNFGLDLLKALK